MRRARCWRSFPAARAGEIGRHLADFVATAQAIVAQRPAVQVIVSAPPSITLDPARCPFPVVRDQSHTVFRAATAAMCKSGTTTLEAALCGCPLVVAYRTSPMTYAIAKRLVTLPRHRAREHRRGGVAWRRSSSRTTCAPTWSHQRCCHCSTRTHSARTAMLASLADVRARMGEPGAAVRVAAMVDELVA